MYVSQSQIVFKATVRWTYVMILGSVLFDALSNVSKIF